MLAGVTPLSGRTTAISIEVYVSRLRFLKKLEEKFITSANVCRSLKNLARRLPKIRLRRAQIFPGVDIALQLGV